MSFLDRLKAADPNNITIAEVVIGLVVEAKVITNIPGYDYELTLHSMTKDETVVNLHRVKIPANQQSINDIKQELYGKFVLTAKDELERGIYPIRGRLQWSSDRYVRMAPYKRFEIKYHPLKSENETIGVFNDDTRKKLTLPIPPRGWHCTTLTFITKTDEHFKFVYDGVKE